MLSKTEYSPVEGKFFLCRILPNFGCLNAPLQNRFVSLIKKTSLPPRRDAGYADALRTLHSVILGLCALVESMPYSVESWMPPLTEGRYL
jgi:hypothetical protein